MAVLSRPGGFEWYGAVQNAEPGVAGVTSAGTFEPGGGDPVVRILAADGREALERVATAGLFDLVLVDWNMPCMNGYEFLQVLRADPVHAGTPVVMVTTANDVDDVIRALAAGANEYILKPFTKDVIREKLHLLQIRSA